MVKQSKIEEDIKFEIEKLKNKDLTMQEIINIVNENYLTEGCNSEHVKPCGMLCTYHHGCSFKMHYQNNEEYCMKNWKK